jgi:pyruvate,orthophosphate dikinase
VDAIPAVIGLDEPLPQGVDPTAVLGGKAAGLAIMARDLGLAVPLGFVVTTAVCQAYLEGGWPAGVREAIVSHLGRLGDQTGRRFGDASAPLLVSVRSGAPVSMPGMMDTILNAGITPAIRERLAAESGSPEFAADTWLRFSRMFAEIVLGVPREEVSAAALHEGDAASILAAADRVRALARRFGGIPDDPFEQVVQCVGAVFRSWRSPRAEVFRAREGIPAGPGTAATVQAMVFGNLDDRSGTGVVFTRNPATGAAEPFGDYLPRAQGEDVVAGSHAVQGLSALRDGQPEVYENLLAALARLERHFRDMCDVEFTVSSGKLYILQTRIGRRSPLAAVRIAVAMAEDPDFPLTRAEAVGRINDDVLARLAALGRVEPSAVPVASGLAASPGVGAGVLCCDADRAAELAARGTAVVLARPETSPADVHGMMAASGLVTTLGGVASHAAVVARSWAIPAVCSLAGATVESGGIRVGGMFIAEGETVTVDGSAGTLYVGDCRAGGADEVPELATLRAWAAGAAEAVAPAPTALARPVTLFEVCRAVQLKGLCNAERAAAAVGSDPAAVERLFAEHAEYFRQTPRGIALSPAGRSWVTAALQEEVAGVDREAMERAYARFIPLNEQFKRLVSEWQLKSAAGNAADGWDTLVARVRALHGEFRPIVEETAKVAGRLAPFTPRFEAALAAMAAGDASMLASPLKDSYHTVWFEYHEELIALTGRDRSVEEQ